MICIHCKKQLTKTIDLFNGKRICPSCMKEASPIPDAPQIKEGTNAEELYRLSRSYFFHGIAREIGKENVPAGTPDYEECFERATSLCLEAALTGHPEAMWNMGFYYDKDFVETDRTELERCRVATQYYKAIACHSANDVAGWKGDFKELRVRSARDLIKMLSGLSERERKNNFFQKAVEEVRATGLISNEEVEELFSNGKSRGTSLGRRLDDLFASAVSKKRAPTFGILFTTKEELRQNLDTILNADVVVKSKKLELAFAPISDSFAYVDSNHRNDFRPVLTSDSIRAKIEGDELPDGNVVIYFFNNAGKHGHFNSAGERAGIRKWIEHAEFQAITRLIEASKGHPCIFFDDDVFYYKKQQRVSADVVGLIEEFI